MTDATVAPELATTTERAFAMRRALYDELPVAPVGISIDGSVAALYGPLDLGVVVGDLVVVELDDGDRWVAQVRELRMVEREAAEVALPAEGLLPSTKARPLLRAVSGEAAVLGRLTGDVFEAGSGPVFAESRLRPATAAEAAAVFTGGGQDVQVGTLLRHPAVPATVQAEGFARHTFLCGQSGSGKTYTTGVLLEQLLLATDLPVIVLDPNSDYVGLGELAQKVTPEDRSRYGPVAGSVLVARGRGAGGSALLGEHFSDLSLDVQAAVAGLDALADLADFAALRDVTESLEPPYSVTDVLGAARRLGSQAAERVAIRLRNLGVADWDLWCRKGERSLVGSGLLLQNRCSVLDVGSLDTPREVALVAFGVLRGLWERRRDRRSVLLVVDEAHNVFPTTAEDAIGRALTELGVLVAGEGRKYGLHLLLCTQRPAKLHPNVLSQCENLVLLRMNSATDIEELVGTFSHVPAGMIRRASSLRLGEVLVAGRIAPIPTYLRTRTRLSREGGSDVATPWWRPATTAGVG